MLFLTVGKLFVFNFRLPLHLCVRGGTRIHFFFRLIYLSSWLDYLASVSLSFRVFLPVRRYSLFLCVVIATDLYFAYLFTIIPLSQKQRF